jgi:hypothetical protein
MVPGRAGADTQAVVHIPISQLRQLPGAPELEDAWIRSRIGEDGFLAGKDAQAAACDAMTVPVVTGRADMTAIDKMIAMALAVENCVVLCQFHHDICIHRWGWELTLHPDGTTEARSPDGSRILRSHPPPAPQVG